MSGGNGQPPDGTTPLIYVAALTVVLFVAQVIRACRDFAVAGKARIGMTRFSRSSKPAFPALGLGSLATAGGVGCGLGPVLPILAVGSLQVQGRYAILPPGHQSRAHGQGSGE